jgi:hypothetical protein
MGPAGHLVFGFTAKHFTPDTPVVILLIAALPETGLLVTGLFIFFMSEENKEL